MNEHGQSHISTGWTGVRMLGECALMLLSVVAAFGFSSVATPLYVSEPLKIASQTGGIVVGWPVAYLAHYTVDTGAKDVVTYLYNFVGLIIDVATLYGVTRFLIIPALLWIARLLSRTPH